MHNSKSGAAHPLSGIRIIDLGQVYQGPYATFLMAKAGADVIKVEPVGGETLRGRATLDEGAQLPFEMLNANKRGITLNLKSDEGREILIDLVRKADVLLENFAPGAMEKLGLGWDVLHEANPRLVYASGTGFGLSGPDRDRLAMDLTVQAVVGVMSATGMPDGPPVKAGPAIADFSGGIHLYAGVVTALLERERTGVGRFVEISMEETVLPTLSSTIGMLHGREGMLPRTGNRHSGLAVAPYNVYRAADGYVAVLVVQPAHWDSLLRAMEREDLIDDPRFATNAARVARMDETDQIIEEWTQQRSKAEIAEVALRNRIPCAPVRDVSEVLLDPHMHERGMLQWVDNPRLGRTVMFDTPLLFHGVERLAPLPSPALGEHCVEVLRDVLGLSDDTIARLDEAGVIKLASGQPDQHQPEINGVAR